MLSWMNNKYRNLAKIIIDHYFPDYTKNHSSLYKFFKKLKGNDSSDKEKVTKKSNHWIESLV